MDTQKWVAWAEIVASIAVVVTLVFLTYEVRQNTMAIERQTNLDRQSRLIDPYLESPLFRSVYAKIKAKDGREPRVAAFIGRYDLTDEDAVLWVRHLDENWTGLETDFLQFGSSDELDDLISGFLKFPDGALYWDVSMKTGRFSQAFRNHVESLRLTD